MGMASTEVDFWIKKKKKSAIKAFVRMLHSTELNGVLEVIPLKSPTC